MSAEQLLAIHRHHRVIISHIFAISEFHAERDSTVLGDVMIVLGIVLLVVGFLLGIHILWTLGIILVVVGVVLFLLGSVGRPVLGRRHYW